MRIRAAVVAASLAVSPAFAGAPAAPPIVVTAVSGLYVPGAADYRELPLVVPRGGRLFFANTDAVNPPAHSIRSYDVGADGALLFSSGSSSSFGETAEVVGVAALPPGEYRFYCHVHTAMNGLLTVVDG